MEQPTTSTPKQQTINELHLLKSEAYDCFAQIEQWQKRLTEINQKIAQLQQNLNQS